MPFGLVVLLKEWNLHNLTAIFLASLSALRFAAISFSNILFSIKASSSLKPKINKLISYVGSFKVPRIR